ncbi:MAG: DUF4255 domain-containing protein [Dongiaceae bacterium]
MALLDSQEAIGAVSELLRSRISARLNSLNVLVGRPEGAVAGNGRKLNLFLYRIGFDPQLRNEPIERGQEPPLWVVLHYLLTAFDDAKESDSVDAHRLLGRGMAALQEMNFIRPQVQALARNPEPLKITFDEADVELLSKLMQGSDEKYRVSAAFQVRPVMIAPDNPASYAPLVKSVGPPASPGVEVLPNLGPRLLSLSPERFTAPATLTLTGLDLGGIDQLTFGPLTLPPTVAPDGTVTATLPGAAALSAGAYPVAVSRLLASGHRLGSDPLLAHLLPKLLTATPGGLLPVSAADPRLHGPLSLTGERLGGPDDSIFVAFYGGGALRLALEAVGTATQTGLAVTVPPAKALAPGPYLILLRVNGEQADDAPTVSWT